MKLENALLLSSVFLIGMSFGERHKQPHSPQEDHIDQLEQQAADISLSRAKNDWQMLKLGCVQENASKCAGLDTNEKTLASRYDALENEIKIEKANLAAIPASGQKGPG